MFSGRKASCFTFWQHEKRQRILSDLESTFLSRGTFPHVIAGKSQVELVTLMSLKAALQQLPRWRAAISRRISNTRVWQVKIACWENGQLNRSSPSVCEQLIQIVFFFFLEGDVAAELLIFFGCCEHFGVSWTNLFLKDLAKSWMKRLKLLSCLWPQWTTVRSNHLEKKTH